VIVKLNLLLLTQPLAMETVPVEPIIVPDAP
jgi:hypothetical protein